MRGSEPKPARSKPWLDGGYDRDEVEACRYHPDHAWIVQRVGAMVEYPRDPDELLTVCRGCLVPRCGYTEETNPCILPRHHRERHLYLDGTQEPADEWPGSQKPPPPNIGPAKENPHA